MLFTVGAMKSMGTRSLFLDWGCVWQRGQERRVDVELTIAPAIDEATGQQPHEAGVADQLDPVIEQRLMQLHLERHAGAELLVVDRDGLDAGLGRTLQARRLRPV